MTLVVLFSLAGYSAYWNLNKYFVEYKNLRPGDLRDQITRFLSKNKTPRLVINLFSGEENFSYESYKFMAPTITGHNISLEDINYPMEGSFLFIYPTCRSLDGHLETIFEGKDIRFGTHMHHKHPFNWAVVNDNYQ